HLGLYQVLERFVRIGKRQLRKEYYIIAVHIVLLDRLRCTDLPEFMRSVGCQCNQRYMTESRFCNSRCIIRSRCPRGADEPYRVPLRLRQPQSKECRAPFIRMYMSPD